MGVYKNPIEFVPNGSKLTFVEKATEGTNCIGIYKCECGVEKEMTMNNVRRGKVVSCGCFQKSEQSKRATTHGLSKHPLFRVWQDIIVRCEYENRGSDKYYKSKGVTICNEWRHDFKPFYDWAISNGWGKGMEVDKDKIPNQLGVPAILYSPEMCSVLTKKENCNLRTSNRLLTLNGETKNVTQWEEHVGLPSEVILQRLNRGWDVERSILTPLVKGKNKKYGQLPRSRQNG